MTEFRFPLKDVKIRNVKIIKKVTDPVYSESYWQMSQREFAMHVEGVGDFYACDGCEIEFTPANGADPNSIELYLNGSVYGAILHQRKILAFHGSSFLYDSAAVMICGDAGAGKSSLTASFCLSGSEFLTDDITPVIIREGRPYLLALSDRIKLWSDTLEQFGRFDKGLPRVHPEVDKYYLSMSDKDGGMQPLGIIVILSNSADTEVHSEELSGTAKFAAVQGEIYRSEYLPAMPDNLPVYFRNTLDICRQARVFRVFRPARIRVPDLHRKIEDLLVTVESE